MPLVEVTIAQGRSADQIRAMMHEVHQAVLRTVNTRPEHIRVIVREVPRTHWATGDLTIAEMDIPASTQTTPEPGNGVQP
jgi:4-oxalocrotonate tautomerase